MISHLFDKHRAGCWEERGADQGACAVPPLGRPVFVSYVCVSVDVTAVNSLDSDCSAHCNVPHNGFQLAHS